jgi:hypothetical protein
MEAKMVAVIVVVREIDRTKPEYSLHFELPELPRIGDYISVYRPDSQFHTEDLVVRHIWWHLQYDDTRGVVESGHEHVGKVREIMIECDQAIGPHSRDRWRQTLTNAKNKGVDVVEFEIARFSVSEAELNRKR